MLGTRIAQLRQDAGLSQSALAVKLNISPSAIGMYEQGRREPSADTLVALAKAFGVTTDYLLTGKQETKEEQALSRALLGIFPMAGHSGVFSRQELIVLLAALLMDA